MAQVYSNNNRMRITFTQTKDTSNNRSTIKITAIETYIPYADGIVGYPFGTLTVAGSDGTRKTIFSYGEGNTSEGGVNQGQGGAGWYSVGPSVSSIASFVVGHNADGSASLTFSSGNIWLNSPYGTTITELPLGSFNTTSTLDSIARTTPISSASNVTLGNTCSISWTPASTSFKYKIKFTLGSWSYTTAFISPNRTTSYTYTGYTIPVDPVARYITMSTSATMSATLTTYNSNESVVGTAPSKDFTVYVPSTVVPTLTLNNISLNNDANSVIKRWNVAVSGFTKAVISATASGSYGSTITGFTVSGDYSTTTNTTSLNVTTGTLSSLSDGSKTYKVKCTDTRGRSSSEQSKSISVYAYSSPSISSFSATRGGSGNTSAIIKAAWSYTSIGGRNSATGVLKYKLKSESGWRNYGYITNGATLTLSNFSIENSYDFQLIVTDTVGMSTSITTAMSTIDVLLDFRAGGKGLGIGKICESNALEIGMDTDMTGHALRNCNLSSGNVGQGQKILDCIVNRAPVGLSFWNSQNADDNPVGNNITITAIYKGSKTGIWSHVVLIAANGFMYYSVVRDTIPTSLTWYRMI